MLNWKPFELHTHTVHSDGDFTPTTMLETAQTRGFIGVALTDHNTVSGLEEYHSKLKDMKMCGIDGIEWTTYFGHMLVLGEKGYTDWRGVQPNQIDKAVSQIRANGGLVGLAHPFSLSNPINTGYEWKFEIEKWENINYIEVWSRDFSPCAVRSFRAFRMWEELLLKGYHIGATSGRDWHRPDVNSTSYGTTFLGFDGEITPETALDAVRRGRMCVTAGPLLTMSGVTQDGTSFSIGDTISADTVTLHFAIDFLQNVDDWKRFSIEAHRLEVIQNGKVIAALPAEDVATVSVKLEPGYLRADLVGQYLTKENHRIAFTNPIYIG